MCNGGSRTELRTPRSLYRQRRELMHDHLRLGGRHRLGNRVGVESVGHDRARSQAAYQVLLRCALGHPDHLVASRHELRDKPSAENARGAGYEDLDDCSSRLIAIVRRDRGAACDSAQRSVLSARTSDSGARTPPSARCTHSKDEAGVSGRSIRTLEPRPWRQRGRLVQRCCKSGEREARESHFATGP